jgi:hypothetical protein
LNNSAPDTCSLCEREVARTTKHHLTPKSEGGTEIVDLCLACHKTLHKFFTNRTLAKKLNTIDALRQTPEVRRYLAWVRKQSDRAIKVRASRGRR